MKSVATWNGHFMHPTENPLGADFIDKDTYVVKRKHVSRVDWTRAVARAMASNRDLKTQTALAKRSGMAQSTIGRILRGEVDPQSGNLERIAKAFNLSLAELAELGQEGEVAAEPTDILKLVERSTRVALVSWDQVVSFADPSHTPQSANDEHWMPRPKHSGARTFALRVRGEAMEPGYQHGDFIFVDPDVAPEHGKDVVVRLDDRDEVVFRRLVVEGKLEYLKPANSGGPHRIIEISAHPGAQILGVVIGKWVEK
jgi:SOS-response transcriptional repressor LexA